MTWRPDPATRQRGFTLIEMIVVLVVLGAMLGLVLTRGPVRSAAVEARAAAGQLAEALRGARGQAIAANRPVVLAMDIAARSWRVDGGPPRLLPAGLAVSANVTAEQTDGRRIAAIRFDPDGSASGGGFVLADAHRRMTVGVDWLTGRVSVADAKP